MITIRTTHQPRAISEETKQNLATIVKQYMRRKHAGSNFEQQSSSPSMSTNTRRPDGGNEEEVVSITGQKDSLGNFAQKARSINRIESIASSKVKRGDSMWTEIAKNLVIEEAITQKGYEFEEDDEYLYVLGYLRYASCPLFVPHKRRLY